MATRTHKSQTSYTDDAVLTTTYADDFITKGNGFQIKKRIDLTAGQTIYLEFDITKAVGKTVYSLPLRMSTGGGMVYVDSYNADSSTGGTTLATPNNLNGKSSTAALTTVKTGVTVTGTATNVREYVVGILSTKQSSGGGQGGVDVPKILDNSKPLYFKIENTESAAVVLDFEFVWYEI